MNKIRNALSDMRPPEPGAVTWELREDKKEKRIYRYEVPSLPDDGERLSAIWNKYFELLFFRFHLLKRFRTHSDEIKKNARVFYDDFYDDKGKVRKERLLELLAGNPRDWADRTPYGSAYTACDALWSLFNYDSFLSDNGTGFSELVSLLEVNVCPYCGRAFTHTVRKAGKGGYLRTCQADHYYPKSRYPWLALSIRNLIPVCGPCNLRKLDDSKPILYPYEEEMGDAYRFRTHPVKGLSYLLGGRNAEDEFEVKLEMTAQAAEAEAKRKGFCKRADNEIELLGLNALYSTHNGYVLNVFRQRYIFGEPYVEMLLRAFPELFHSPEELRAMLYFKSIAAERIGSAPLDKLTRDVDREIDELEGLA